MPGVKFGGKNCFDEKNCLFMFKTIHQNAAQVLLIMTSKTLLAIVLYTNMAAVMSGANQESPKDHHREASNLNNEAYSVLTIL